MMFYYMVIISDGGVAMDEQLFNPQPPNNLIGIFTHLELCPADAIHNFKWI